MGKLRRNLENTNGFVQATYKDVQELKNSIPPKLDLIWSMVQKATFQTNMKGCDISEFFPVEKKEQLELFMDREHKDWEDRKAEFYNLLYTIASNVKKGFARGLIKALFTREYICKARWPSFGYNYFKLLTLHKPCTHDQITHHLFEQIRPDLLHTDFEFEQIKIIHLRHVYEALILNDIFFILDRGKISPGLSQLHLLPSFGRP